MLILDVLDALLLTAISLECFRILQSCSYKPQRGYFKIFASVYFLVLIFTQVLTVLCHFLWQRWCATVLFGIATAVSVFKKRKCPLKFTKRIVRMLVVQLVLIFVLCHFVGSCYFAMALPIIAVVSWLICLPVDGIIANYYLKKAVKKLSQSGITVVAITGSYGKTCTKDMLATLLNDSIAPSGSCNTPLGIAKFVNSTDLSPYKHLILEFGARNVGDIQKLCKLFQPICGIVTGICEQHLSTFKTLGNIVKTKGELVENLPQKGFCVLNSNDSNTQSLSQVGVCRKVLTDKSAIQNQQTTLQGTQFVVKHNGQLYQICLPQISNYIVDTFLMCFEMCKNLGQDVVSTVNNCQKVAQTPHRMQILHNGTFYIVDDAYNANIKGISNCCITLSHFDNYKIVLTQGIVEGGKLQRTLNERCGQMLGAHFDVVIAIGKYANHILKGANNCNCKVVYAKNLAEGTRLLQRYTKPNCIVLFQNDLPDVVSL